MRKILFRGKSEDNGEWVYGYYACIGKHHYILTGKLNLIGAVNFEHYLVIPETVGQFTGLYDKNGKKIFEGDTVWFGEEKERGVVYFDNSCSRFAVRFDTFDAAFDHLYSNELEIIGNVHDNPELMEGGE